MGEIGRTTCRSHVFALLIAAIAGLILHEAKAQFYDFSSSDGGWTATPLGNPATWTWVSGTGWVTPGGTNADTTVVSPTLTHPDSVWRLTGSFKHYFNFESGYDYGYLQYSVNGGSWITVPNSLLSGFTYNNGAQTVFTGLQGNAGSQLTTNFSLGSSYFSPADQVQIRFIGHWDEGFTPAGADWTITSLSLTMIPEPTSWGLALGCGLAGLVLSRRRARMISPAG